MKHPSRQPGPDQKVLHAHSYLLRLWYADGTLMGEWRASLEDLHTSERSGFSGLEQLFTFIMALCEKSSSISS